MNLDNSSAISSNNPTFVKKKTLHQRKSIIFGAIQKSNKPKSNDEVNPFILMGMKDNTDDFVDENGRTIRYCRIIDP